MSERVTQGWARLLTRLALVIAFVCGAGAVCGQPRFAVSTDGTVVTDTRTGLVWRRCSAGQTFDGTTCSGTASAYTLEQALAYARTESGWRLPNVKELSSIVDSDRINPSIDPVAFPRTPMAWHRSSSPMAGYPSYAWYVNFGNGGLGGFNLPNEAAAHVRLVR